MEDLDSVKKPKATPQRSASTVGGRRGLRAGRIGGLTKTYLPPTIGLLLVLLVWELWMRMFMVAQTIATSHPSRVSSLMLVSTTSGSDTKGRAAIDKRARVVKADGMSALVEDTMRRWFTDSAIVADAPFLSAARNTLLSGDPTAHAAYWRAIGDFDHRSSLPAIRARTQIVVGDQDASTPVTAAEAIAAGIPDAQLVVVSGGTHMFPFEERKLFAQLVQDFWNHETSGGPDQVARPEGGR